MNRHEALQDLSRDHHTTLLHVQRVERALQGTCSGPAPQETVKGFLDAWEEEVLAHFEEEEKVLVPFLEALPGGGPRIHLDRLRSDHGWLRERVGFLRRRFADGAGWPRAAAEVVGRLRAHIRFEEEALFPWVQQHVDEAGLAELQRHGLEYRRMNRDPGSA